MEVHTLVTKLYLEKHIIYINRNEIIVGKCVLKGTEEQKCLSVFDFYLFSE